MSYAKNLNHALTHERLRYLRASKIYAKKGIDPLTVRGTASKEKLIDRLERYLSRTR